MNFRFCPIAALRLQGQQKKTESGLFVLIAARFFIVTLRQASQFCWSKGEKSCWSSAWDHTADDGAFRAATSSGTRRCVKPPGVNSSRKPV